MGILLLDVFPSNIAPQLHDKFALHENWGHGPVLAKETAPFFSVIS